MSRTCDWQNQLPINVIDYKKNCTAFVRDVRFVQYCTYMTLKHRVSKYFWYFTKKLSKIRSYLITISHKHHLIILLFFITGKKWKVIKVWSNLYLHRVQWMYIDTVFYIRVCTKRSEIFMPQNKISGFFPTQRCSIFFVKNSSPARDSGSHISQGQQSWAATLRRKASM